MHRPKILFVAPTAYLLTGLGTWLDYLVPGLRQRGWNATLGLVEGPKYHRVKAYLAEHPDEHWISVPCQTGTSTGRQKAIQQAIQKTKTDLIVSVNIPDALVAVSNLPKGNPTRCLMTCHGIQADLFGDMHALRGGIDAVVCTNRLTTELACTHAELESERVFYAPYGTNSCDIKTETFPSRPTFGYIGRLEQPQKRINDVIAIIRELSQRGIECDWILAGNGPLEESVRTELHNEINSGRVKLLGHVSANDIDEEVYAKIDAILITSSWETGPLVAWEAMARGINVVSSRYIGSGLEQALEDDVNALLFDIGDTKAASTLLETLATQESFVAKLKQNAHALVSERYSYESSILQWEDAFQAVMQLPVREKQTRSTETSAVQKTNGRLSRLFGDILAESIRHIVKRQPPDNGPAGEWPHTLGFPALPAEDFLELAVKLDQQVVSQNSPRSNSQVKHPA